MEGISYLGVFLEGLLSFISPCILPLVPLYMTYLTGGLKDKDRIQSRQVLLMTVLFVLGISTTYFILGLSIGMIRGLIEDLREVMMILGGALLIVFAFNGFGFIKIAALEQEHKFSLKLDGRMSLLKAYLLGFVFSFAWTPCIGPMLTSVLLLAAGSEAALGNLLILLYCAGFALPFILIGLFYTKAIAFIKAKRDTLLKLAKLSSVILLLFGAYMIYDGSSTIIGLKQQLNSKETTVSSFMDQPFYDQFAQEHRLSDYSGRYITLNFVASWCTYCVNEIPDYKTWSNSSQETVSFYVMSDTVNSANGGQSTADFIAEHGIEVPILIDEDDVLFSHFGISSFPTMFYIGPDGNVIGYQSGAMDYDTMAYVMDIVKDKYEGGD